LASTACTKCTDQSQYSSFFCKSFFFESATGAFYWDQSRYVTPGDWLKVVVRVANGAARLSVA
jgi:hypothetical protein